MGTTFHKKTFPRQRARERGQLGTGPFFG